MSTATVLVLVFLVLASVYLFYYFKQTGTVVPVINEVNSTLAQTTTTAAPAKIYTTTPLLFSNVRWAEMPISVYTAASNCTTIQIQEMQKAMEIWKNKTNGIISFTTATSDNADVVVDCTKETSSVRDGNKIIRKVGEGGPSSVYDTGLFNLTTKGNILLYTSNADCDTPVIALHEMGHVLGLDHSDNPNSVMYEYEDCNQTITPEIVSTLQSLYSYPPEADLYFSNSSATQSNYYLFINFTVKNKGLVTSNPTSVSILANGNQVKSIDLQSIKPAQGYFYSLGNIFVSTEVTDLELVIDPQNALAEIDKSNNFLSLTPS